MPKHENPKPKPLSPSEVVDKILDPRLNNLGSLGAALVKAAKS